MTILGRSRSLRPRLASCEGGVFQFPWDKAIWNVIGNQNHRFNRCFRWTNFEKRDPWDKTRLNFFFWEETCWHITETITQQILISPSANLPSICLSFPYQMISHPPSLIPPLPRPDPCPAPLSAHSFLTRGGIGGCVIDL